MSKAFTIDEAAGELRKTTRWLKDWLAKNPVDEAGVPFYVPMGRTKTFEHNDIARIRAAIRRGEQCRLKSSGVTASGITEELLGRLAADSAFAAHVRPRTRTSHRVTLPKSKRNTGTVISMVREPS